MGVEVGDADFCHRPIFVNAHDLGARVRVDQNAIAVELELACTGVGNLAVLPFEGEHAFAIEGQVQRVASLAQLAGLERQTCGARVDPVAELAGALARIASLRIKGIGEAQRRALETGRIQIGGVVGDDAQSARKAGQA